MMKGKGYVKVGDCYYVCIRHKGRLIRKSAGKSLANAQALVVQVRRELKIAEDREALGLPPTPPTALTLSKWIDIFLELPNVKLLSDQRHLPQYGDFWKKHLGNVPLPAITQQAVQTVQRTMIQAKLKPATINRHVAFLKRALNVALIQQEIQVNPLTRFAMLPEDNMRYPTLTMDEQKAILEASPQWMRIVITMAIDTGARLEEINSLRWSEVDFRTKLIRFHDKKTKKYKQIPLTKSLEEHLEAIEPKVGFVIMAPAGGHGPFVHKEPYHPRNEAISHAFKAAVRAESVNRGDLRFHDLRHIASSRLHAAGGGAFDLAQFLGHSTLIVTRRYTVDSVPRLRAFMEQVGTEPTNNNGNTPTK